ncbi:pyridoxal phosphate-dependent decarboxylase family protein [Marinoscillum sp.]|uniref:pyridoxal phosphate-dependent decarboxylase family protein n=1 Tax=Marinoscillum sp. TaxID=2024838 RepID=UPI003BABFBC6
MNHEEFRKNAHAAVDWVADYLQQIEKYPVKSQVAPKDIYNQIAPSPPGSGEPFEALMSDLDNIIMPGITHWQHPHFHAYFPGNSSYPSVIAEILTAGIGAQCMVWETSPAAAELEERMMEWFKEMMGLPTDWHGVIQDTASTATLTALLTAREWKTDFQSNTKGVTERKLRIYCSTETHSSAEKAVKIAGLGSENLVKIPVDGEMSMVPAALQKAIEADMASGYTPCMVISAMGTTGTLAFDPTKQIGEICRQYNIWFHVDAAYAGSALVLPELEWLREGLELADSFVFNPHKWLFTNFDCSAYFVKDKEALIKTFEILPEYLKTKTRGQVNDYRDWGIQLGRRFRALKLWFVIRTYGVDHLRSTIRTHIGYGAWLANQIEKDSHFELLTPQKLNMVVFRYSASDKSTEELNTINESILTQINLSGKAYITHTKVNGMYGIRVVLGQTRLEKKHVENLWGLLVKTSDESSH